jgi:rhamnulokinase
MKNTPSFLAFDLGAESGRASLGRLRNDKLELHEIHRFTNGPVQKGDSIHWDVDHLWREMRHGLVIAAEEEKSSLISLGVDTWGVDFALLDNADNLIGNPFHYRDHRTDGMVEVVLESISPAELFQQTGIQNMAINSLFQLVSMVRSKSSDLISATTFLNIPDLFNFWFSGEKASEFSIATTTQCFNPIKNTWAWEVLEKLKVPLGIFTNVVSPGTKLGTLRQNLKDELLIQDIDVVTVASHDTQSAVAALPICNDDFAYISSGTWSLMGIEVDKPIITEASRCSELTNEGSYKNKFCLQKNIIGLWILQECRREWAKRGQQYSYDDLTKMATKAKSLVSFINLGDPSFVYPGEMTSRIKAFCRMTKQTIPETKAELVRCIFESLAFEYRFVLDKIASVSGQTLEVIHITGGGAQNALLNQFTANATGRTVVAGPIEATSLGNILVQAISAGYIASLEEGRQLIQRSFDTNQFEPEDSVPWNEAYLRYLEMRNYR